MAELAVWLWTVGIVDVAASACVGGRGRQWLLNAAAAIGGALSATWLLGASWMSLALVAFALAWVGLRSRPQPWASASALLLLLLTTCGLALAATSVAPGSPFASVINRFDQGVGAVLAPDVAAVSIGAVLVLFWTGNAIVRAALHAIQAEVLSGPEGLRGGRVIGPLERVLILGFTVSGQLTAAALVISAKGLLRFNDVRHEADSRAASPSPEQLSEYLLVGSLVSWTTALALAGIVALA